jgi:amino acid adenylation domain-containing protein/thioester reductase-like protein
LWSEVRNEPVDGIVGRAVEYPRSRTVIELIEAAAERCSLAPAVTFGGLSLTYRQLNTYAERLAAQLHAMSVRAGDFIPLVMRHGPELPVAMLASMKLGAPFVPLDEAAPPHVQTEMIDALNPRLVLCSPTSDAMGSPASRVPRVAVDCYALGEDQPALARAGAGRPGLDDIAYGFYTTGSTGAPKCALNIHRGLLNRFLYMSRRFGGQADEVVLQNSRHVFDSSLWQLLWPLTNGSQVVIPERTGILDLQATVDVIERYRITMTDFVPSIFNVLVTMMAARPEIVVQMTSLRRILIGGEEANADSVQAFRAVLPQVTVINTYGPTEASIGSIFHEITDADTGSIPIGSPIDNTYAVIVDDQMRPVTPGATGEILLGGECLGLGYLNDPDRTRAAFIDNPFPGIPGPRLYRTGDLGRYLPGGLIHFAGRADQQVKISGLRVELPDIELALLRNPLVREAKVIVRDGPGGRWLVAFATGVGSGKLDPAGLRAFASGELSPQLVPKEFVILDRMPLNANGKADRRELTRLAQQRRPALDPAGQSADAGEAELAVWRAWQDLLPVPPSSRDDDFFDLGGDSLIAQKLALRLTREVGVAVSVRDVADHPTIAQQASLTGRSGTAGQPGIARARIDADARLPPDITPTAAASGGLDWVLLTGSTGFVGAHLLYEMLTKTQAEVFCIVRADSADAALHRVTGNLTRYRLWKNAFAGRIHASPGDLGQRRFGLDADTYQRLGRSIDTVVHNGALVNLVRGYTAHRAANVVGTVEILRFATAFHVKPVHYISTLSTVADGAGDGTVPAPEAPPPPRLPHGGYGQSKWVAERLLGQADKRGMAVTVYRLGEMMPHSRTGVPSRRGLPDLLAKACLRLGLCFSSPIVMNYTPVDYASRLVVSAISRGETGYFHIRHPEPASFDDLLAVLRAEFGLARASYPQFWNAMRDLADSGADEELLGTLALVPRPDSGTEADAVSGLAALFGDDLSASSTLRTDRLMADTGIRWPPIDRAIFENYAAYYSGIALGRGKR